MNRQAAALLAATAILAAVPAAAQNRIFYDPQKTYLPPLKADGTSFPNASFTAARIDGYDSGSSTRNLGTLSNLNTPSINHDGNSSTPNTRST